MIRKFTLPPFLVTLVPFMFIIFFVVPLLTLIPQVLFMVLPLLARARPKPQRTLMS